MISLVPALICIIAYVIIFYYVRSSTCRVQPHSINTQTSENNISRPKITRRDAHLIRHMIFIVCLFVIGWGFINILGIFGS